MEVEPRGADGQGWGGARGGRVGRIGGGTGVGYPGRVDAQRARWTTTTHEERGSGGSGGARRGGGLRGFDLEALWGNVHLHAVRSRVLVQVVDGPSGLSNVIACSHVRL